MTDLPSTILISPPSKKNEEIKMLVDFFEAVLMRFHLRKPNFSIEELCEYLEQVPEKHLSKIVVHRSPELLKKFPPGKKGNKFTKKLEIKIYFEKKFSLFCFIRLQTNKYRNDK